MEARYRRAPALPDHVACRCHVTCHHAPLRSTQPCASSRSSASAVSARERSKLRASVSRSSDVPASSSENSRPSSPLRALTSDPAATARCSGEPERHEHVERVAHRAAAVVDQLVRAFRCSTADGPGHRHHLSPPQDRLLDREHRAARRRATRRPRRCRRGTAMRRLRAGNRHADGGAPGGASESSTPDSATAAQTFALFAGYTTSSPLPTTPIGGAAAAARAPRCAAASMPRAKPDTIDTPAAARS